MSLEETCRIDLATHGWQAYPTYKDSSPAKDGTQNDTAGVMLSKMKHLVSKILRSATGRTQNDALDIRD